jgi:hypothetical protein
MRIARAILVTLTALSVAMLPAAVASARASSTEPISAHADCCPPGQDCDKQAKRDCTKDAACALKCANASALTLAEIDVVHPSYLLPRLALVTGISGSFAPNPPSPPPRV